MKHDKSEHDRQFKFCTQGTVETNKKHFGPVPDEAYESYFSVHTKGQWTGKNSMTIIKL